MLNKLKEIREEMSITQTELSEKSGVSRTTISGLENGNVNVITNITMSKIARALNKEIVDIFLID